MVTEEQLEAALRDFISNCKGIGTAYDTHCLKCRYHSVCDRLIVWEANASLRLGTLSKGGFTDDYSRTT